MIWKQTTEDAAAAAECPQYPGHAVVIDTIVIGDDPSAVAVKPIGPDAGDIHVTNGVSNTVSILAPLPGVARQPLLLQICCRN